MQVRYSPLSTAVVRFIQLLPPSIVLKTLYPSKLFKLELCSVRTIHNSFSLLLLTAISYGAAKELFKTVFDGVISFQVWPASVDL